MEANCNLLEESVRITSNLRDNGEDALREVNEVASGPLLDLCATPWTSRKRQSGKYKLGEDAGRELEEGNDTIAIVSCNVQPDLDADESGRCCPQTAALLLSRSPTVVKSYQFRDCKASRKKVVFVPRQLDPGFLGLRRSPGYR